MWVVLFKWALKSWQGLSPLTFIFSIIYPLNNSRNFNQILTKKKPCSPWDGKITPSGFLLPQAFSKSTIQPCSRFLYNGPDMADDLKKAHRLTYAFQICTVFSVCRSLKAFQILVIVCEFYKWNKQTNKKSRSLSSLFCDCDCWGASKLFQRTWFGMRLLVLFLKV